MDCSSGTVKITNAIDPIARRTRNVQHAAAGVERVAPKGVHQPLRKDARAVALAVGAGDVAAALARGLLAALGAPGGRAGRGCGVKRRKESGALL
jgi:hypothetical protein